jgi:NAD-reducing hydrogenase small subunit
MAGKVTVASDWLAGCAGCHMSFLDIDERIVDLIGLVNLTATPITDLKHPAKEGVVVGILEGAVNNSTGEEVARRMRERSQILIALGDCAVFGGVPTMRNSVGIQDALQRAYVETESTVGGAIPVHQDIAVMQDCRALDQVVPVDIYLPGCPPSADAIFYVLTELVAGRMPQLKGKYLDWH